MASIVDELPHGGIWIPAEDSSSSWLLVALHGSGGSAHDFDGLDKCLNIPQLNYLYANGPIPNYSAFSWYINTASRHSAYQSLNNLFTTCERKNFPAERTFMLGFSQGAALTFEFAVRYRYLLAGYIALSGRVEEISSFENQGNPKIMRSGHWLVTHGTQDYNLSIDIIRNQVEQLRGMGMKIDYKEYEKIHEMDAEFELRDVSEWIRGRMLSSRKNRSY